MTLISKAKRATYRKADNSHSGAKIALRLALVDNLKKDRLKVLDAYSGTGFLWKQIRAARPDVEFVMTNIEKKKNGRLDAIHGDNVRIMPSLPLAEFDIIDLDAYGVPTEQLAIVAEAAPHVPVLVTCISASVGTVPHRMLDALGIPSEWERDVVQVFKNIGSVGMWDSYCASLGYTRRVGFTIKESIGTKRYDVLLSPKAPAPLQRSGAWSNL
jgi:hypothetical protein